MSDSLELENRLLARFDAASQRRELSIMAECAKILSQVGSYNFKLYGLCSRLPILLIIGEQILGIFGSRKGTG